MSGICIGIDLGTTNSVLSFFRDNRAHLVSDPTSRANRQFLFPSIVAENSEGKLVVGDHAKSYLHNAIKESKRDIGTIDFDRSNYQLPNHELTPVEVAALILRRLIEIAKEVLDVSVIDEAVITVPANFSDAEKNATKDAAELAGIKVVHLIAEPTAAYLSYAHESDSCEEKAFVFDFGGGTLDISIVENIGGVAEGKGVGGDKLLGGKDIDEVFAHYLLEKFKADHSDAKIPEHKQSELKERAESLKISLSSKDHSKLFLANFAEENGTWINLELEISRHDFEVAIQEILNRCKSLIRESLIECRLKPSDVNTVLLVGGSSHIPAVRELVVTTFGAKDSEDVDPDTAVAKGASIRHAMLNDQLDADDGLVLMDISKYGFGVETTEFIGGMLKNGFYSELMPPQTHFPFEAKHEFTLLHADQEEVNISIFQADKADVLVTDTATPTGVTGLISDIPHSVSGVPHKIEVVIKVDESNLISVISSIPDTGQVLPLVIDEFSERLSDDEKSILIDKLSKYDTSSSLDPSNLNNDSALTVDINDAVFDNNEIGQEAKPLVKKALQMLDSIDRREVERLELIIEELFGALKSGDQSTAAVYRDKLTNKLWDLEEDF